MRKPEPYCLIRVTVACEDLHSSYSEETAVECLGTFTDRNEAFELMVKWTKYSDEQIIALVTADPCDGLRINLDRGRVGSRKEAFRELQEPVRRMIAYNCLHWQYIHGTTVEKKPVPPPESVQLLTEKPVDHLSE